MPAPCFAAGVIAAVVGATHDCDNYCSEAAAPTDMVDNKDLSERSVRFHQQHDNVSTQESSKPKIIVRRSVERNSDVLQQYLRNTSLGSSTVLLKNQTEGPLVAAGTTVQGFVNGDFASGKIRDVIVERCFVVSFSGHNDANLLAVGLASGLAFYETTNTYSLVHQCARTDMVSALRWVAPLGSSGIASSSLLLVVGGLDGKVSVYMVDPDILEAYGPTLLYEFQVPNQVRDLDCGFYGKLEPSFFIAVGDTSGSITTASFTNNLRHIKTEIVKTYPTGVLSIAFDLSQSIMVSSTKGGQVHVHKFRRQHAGVIQVEQMIWCTDRSGPVHCVVFDGPIMAFGGYDKTVVLVDVREWAISREILMKGTVRLFKSYVVYLICLFSTFLPLSVLQINTIEFDPIGRYLAVGCRDKTLTLFDTSTFAPVKTFDTLGWVTSVSWGSKDSCLAVRSNQTCITVLDLTPICRTPFHLASRHGESASVSWSSDSTFLVRTVGGAIVVAESCGFRDVACTNLMGTVIKVAFCPTKERLDYVAAIDDNGFLSVFRLRIDTPQPRLDLVNRVYVAHFLRALAWSADGTLIATGGKDRLLHILTADGLRKKKEPIEFGGKVWEVSFASPRLSTEFFSLAVALGDYTTILLNDKFEPSLQIPRSRTCRCVAFHPVKNLLATGDGAGIVAIADLTEEEVRHEIDVGGRINTVAFSPAGDFLLVGSDSNCFRLYEVATFHCVQEISCSGFALTASFSPSGRYLALGSASESYSLIRLGPFLDIGLIPLTLKQGVESLPEWAVVEALYRSGDGPSFLQRQMILGGTESLRRVATILREHPTSIHTFDRSSKEGFFDTVLLLKKPSLLKLAVTVLVDGTLDADRQNNVLTTALPRRGKDILVEIMEHYPPEFVGEILGSMAFVKVPFADERYVESDDILERGSPSYTDPWPQPKGGQLLLRKDLKSGVSRTAAVLPLPGLGEMDFLATLLSNASVDVFDNGPMALVLRVLWKDHIRVYFYLDFSLFIIFYFCWVALNEVVADTSPAAKYGSSCTEIVLGLATLVLNTLFALKEVFQSRIGKRTAYWRSLWNFFDILSFCCVYLFIAVLFLGIFDEGGQVPLSVVTSALLTVKLLSYLRGFADTGWLISVLIANFRDVRGFLIILFAVLMGFAVSFRALFADTGAQSFSSLRRAFLSTFQLTTTGSFDSALLFDAEYSALAALMFTLAVTCVLVVCLSALISILADSYARVQVCPFLCRVSAVYFAEPLISHLFYHLHHQVHAVANRRKEQASLVVEYLMLLPPWKRSGIEHTTQWFHTLLEVDADGGLLVETNDWEGGLNSLRRDVERLTESNAECTQRALQSLRDEVGGEVQNLKRELMSLLDDVSEDVKYLRKRHAEGGLSFNGKNVARAVKAVQSVGKKGSALFGKKDD
jgi:WD40 repeat protein